MTTTKIGRNYGPLPTQGVSVNNNGPSLWDHIIQQINPFLPPGTRAVVAGGSVRDFALGFAPKDIDVFLVSETPDYPVIYELALNNLSATFPLSSHTVARVGATLSSNTVDSFGQRITVHYKDVSYVVEVIVGKADKPHASTKDLLDDFDYGLVRAVYDPAFTEPIQVHSSFLLMAEDGVMRVNRKAPAHRRQNADLRYSNFRRRNTFKVPPPTEWISTDTLPAGTYRANLEAPAGYSYIEMVWEQFASLTLDRMGVGVGEAPTAYHERPGDPHRELLTRLPNYRFSRTTPNSSNILRYRFAAV